MLGDGIAFAGVSKYPARVKCALLGWMAFKDAAAQSLTARNRGDSVPARRPPAAPISTKGARVMTDVAASSAAAASARWTGPAEAPPTSMREPPPRMPQLPRPRRRS